MVAYALENAFLHGNGNDPRLAVAATYFVGRDGLVARIEDEGSGFDFRTTQQNFEQGKVYMHRHGNGFRKYNQPDAEVSFEGAGNIVNIMSLFSLAG
jgi:anti-sigma regulatory factor (Ser/Thr protein kinase)